MMVSNVKKLREGRTIMNANSHHNTNWTARAIRDLLLLALWCLAMLVVIVIIFIH